MPTDRIAFLELGFDRLTMDEVLGRLAGVRADDPFTYLVTPNVDHVVRIEREGIAELYTQADLCLCDSRVLHKLARLQGIDLPVVPGSDLTRRLLDEVVVPSDRLCVVGGDSDMIAALRRLYPRCEFIHHEPPHGLRSNEAARNAAAEAIVAARARFTFLAVGSPQQEMIAAAVRKLPGAGGTALCIGASLDFIVGKQRRAPRLLQKLTLEWAYRLAAEPKRMWRRYLVDGPRIFLLTARHYGRRRDADQS